MKLRSHFLPTLNNQEVEDYLKENDVIFVPIGPVEMHGGLPLDCETVVSEALALLLAQRTNSLVLPNLPYIYSGATASGRGTVQLSVKGSIAFLSEIAHSLLRQGFKRQVYLSLHGPAHMSVSPMVRDFFDETGVPILYLDTIILMQKSKLISRNPIEMMQQFDAMILAGYKLRNRLEDVPLTTEYSNYTPQSVERFNELFGSAYQSGAIGYYFGEHIDHAPTRDIPTPEAREKIAEEGMAYLNELVELCQIEKKLELMRDLEAFTNSLKERYPWIPSNK